MSSELLRCSNSCHRLMRGSRIKRPSTVSESTNAIAACGVSGSVVIRESVTILMNDDATSVRTTSSPRSRNVVSDSRASS